MFGFSTFGSTAFGTSGPPAVFVPDPNEVPNPGGRDYPWLVESVKRWSRRKDLADFIGDLVLFAEERMSADLDARGIEAEVAISTIAGSQVVALPADVIEVRSIAVAGYAPLGYLSRDTFNERYSDGCISTPQHYTVIGNAIHLGPRPDATYQLTVSAHRSLAPLTDENPTNWLIQRNPSLYLAATMVEAMINLRDAEGQAVWEGKYAVALNAANSTSNTAGPLVVRSDSRTP